MLPFNAVARVFFQPLTFYAMITAAHERSQHPMACKHTPQHNLATSLILSMDA